VVKFPGHCVSSMFKCEPPYAATSSASLVEKIREQHFEQGSRRASVIREFGTGGGRALSGAIVVGRYGGT
jgi:hypothetical protein